MEAAPEFVASELKKLVGWGAHPKRLALLPHLRQVTGITDDVPVVEAGYLIRRRLTAAIDSLEQPQQLNGRLIEPLKLRRVLRLLLAIEGTGLSAPNRRSRAILLLDMYVSVEQFRRPYGLERSLMQLLAERIVS